MQHIKNKKITEKVEASLLYADYDRNDEAIVVVLKRSCALNEVQVVLQ